MQIISRPRNSGKTTMLLHYMELVRNSILITRCDEDAIRTFEFSKTLGLHIEKSKFIGMIHLNDENRDRIIILVDDIDYIIKVHPKLGYELIKKADIITITKGDQNGKFNR